MTPQAMREQARELILAAKARLDGSELSQVEKIQVSVITDQVNAFTLATMADLIDQMTPYSRAAKARKIIEQNEAIRTAAAKGFASGDWTDLDNLVGDEPGGNGGS